MIKKCSDLNHNETGIIKNIYLEEQKKFKLIHLGVLQNNKITCKFKSPFNTPIAYQINGCIFAMREYDAKKIEVEV